MRIVAVISLITLLTLAACGGDDTSGEAPTTTAAPTTTTAAPDGDVTIVDVIKGFEFYNPCQNSTIDVKGTAYYSVPEGSMADSGDFPDIDESRYPLPDEPQGFARVVPPGPGDDVGTMVVYSDGIARFESDSGLVSWFTDQEQTYNWVC
jgi:hypothetical protein